MLREMVHAGRMTTDLPGRCARVFLADSHRLTVFARHPHEDGPGSKAGLGKLGTWEGVGSRGSAISGQCDFGRRRNYLGALP